MRRVALIAGLRTPFCKANGLFNDWLADDLGALVVAELYRRFPVPLDEVILGNVLQPSHATNLARVIAVKAGLPLSIPAETVNRNCASGMEAITTAAERILLGHADTILAGGVESMSNFPLLFPKKMKDFLFKWSKAKGWKERLLLAKTFRPHFVLPQKPSIADPLCGLTMGQTAENLSRDFCIDREEQDLYALRSQQRAVTAERDGRFLEEITPTLLPPPATAYQSHDDGPRPDQTLAALQALRPAFDPIGTVTAGNSSPVTDGAAVVLLMEESRAKALKLPILAYIRGFAQAGLDPSRMGLGPAYATAKLLDQESLSLNSIDLIEINEAFAVQILAVQKAFASKTFCHQQLNRSQPIGELSDDRLNVNGGAIALGHPLGASGARLILTLALELRKRNKNLGLATLCIGGGQGQACLLEVS